ncbi:ExbD/TolR family protein [Novosphingobium taihuense]|uniref:Biopolymer transport protein ExbD n=1 Tax=Novosphingobium taihuense TaxID=260085 RepID=A0A7W7EUK9_9SPHN|nr:biopolymer transporter ExbD [Novosphingobium taihuense]MBB4614492.1 biopolymer transport protein ExbD [Novosphingobium taihuense]TWH86265.1 outer membrane transport energization protein ExbD [Novosphingobium taihuense]
MAMSGGKDDGSPMMEMNTTPLIDVMLVLLIMFIITIPVATHAVNIDLPQPTNIPNDVKIDPIKNKLVLTATNQILWNGAAISEGQLVSIIASTKGIDPEPELQFQPEEYASYEIANRMMKIITDAKVTKFGFVGNENFATFEKGPA